MFGVGKMNRLIDWNVLGILRETFCRRTAWIIVLLALLNFFSALMVVYVRDEGRVLFVHLQTLMKEQNSLYTEWTQLLLEESTWRSYGRIETEAKDKLGMIQPDSPQLLTLPS
ncbi:cell division protein FtsL [Piscirickettsia salmonis]|nr:cell division protein FtsL [Piscirickettsia salmonis]